LLHNLFNSLFILKEDETPPPDGAIF